MSEWKEYLLQDLFDVQNGYAFKSGDFTQNEGFSLEVLKMGHIAKGGGLRKNPKKDFIPRSKKIEKWILNKNDIVMAMTDMKDNVVILGVPALIDLDNKYVLNQRVARLSLIRPDIADVFFIYNYLKWKDFILELQSKASSGVQVNLSTESIKKSLLSIPPLPEQKAIAAVLSSLDDKIDLLHRQNKTLEAMAETLFRQWFVEEADEGWEEGKLGDLCIVITKGTTPTTLGHQFVDTGVNFVKAESITDFGDFIWGKFAKISEETHNVLNRSILKEGDVLCSIAGTIGRVAITSSDILPANANQAIALLRTNQDKCFPEFIYLFLKSPLFRHSMDGKIVHAVQPNLSLGEISNSLLKIPSSSSLEAFKGIVQPIFKKKSKNYDQIRTLEKLRDTLLPKLMSGEVRVAL